MGKQPAALSPFTTEDVHFLQRGLDALQAVLGVTQQPIPSRLDRLRRQLRHWESMEHENWPERDTMSAREVASHLNVTPQQVYQLGAKMRLIIADKGRRGRGHSTLYTTASVRRYAENRPLPGRRSQSHLGRESL
jgi:hypothetical protein